jgi:hypothetical protein
MPFPPRSPRGHAIFHHGALFEPVFDGVGMVPIGYFMEFLEVLARLSHLVLGVMLSGHDILLIGSIHFLVVIVVRAGRDCDPSRAPLLPLFAALGDFLSALASGFGRCCPVTAKNYFPTA